MIHCFSSKRCRDPDRSNAKFRAWCDPAAGAAVYAVKVRDIGGHHPELGDTSQIAVFRIGKKTAPRRRREDKRKTKHC